MRVFLGQRPGYYTGVGTRESAYGGHITKTKKGDADG